MLGYIYKTTNIITGDFYIGKRYSYKDEHISTVYLGSGVRLAKQIEEYGRRNFTREILCYCDSSEKLVEKEKEYIYKFRNDPKFLNYENGIGYGGIYYVGNCSICGKEKVLYHMDTDLKGVCMSCIKQNDEAKYYCDICERETYHYKNGKCKSCVSRHINKKKFCDICQKETTHIQDYCRSHKIKLKKTSDGRVEVYVKHGQGYGHPWILFLKDISFIKDIQQVKTLRSTAYNLPHDSLKIKCNDEFVSLNTLLYNTSITDWLRITYKIDDIIDNIQVTTDHPLPISTGEVKRADELTLTDKLIVVNNTETKTADIINIEKVDECCRSYDVSTDTEYFNLSHNILSHNCRAFLSPWFEQGGEKPADENDKPIFVGRFNIGAVSLHLPMILAKSRQEGKDFYEVLDYYMELIRKLHQRTYDYLGELKASTNPLAYCEGGFYGGHLNYTDKIKPLLKAATASFGITALNELQQLYNKKSLVEDGQFALEVMQHIIDKVNEFKAEDHNLYALYGTPAESLCLCGDEVVQCYGGNKKIRDIKVGDLVYTYNNELKEIQLKPVLASTKTKENAVVVKVITDNGQEFICTPEHPFGIRKMMKNEETGKFIREEVAFVPAKDLKPGMRLKSNYIREDINTHRVTFSCGRVKYRFQVHGKYLYGDYRPGYEIHHIDHNKNNDNFENLQKLTVKEHRQHHYKLQGHQFTHENKGEKNYFYGKHHTVESNTKNRLWHIYDGVERFSLTGEHLEHFDCMEDASRKGYVRNSVSLCCKKKYEHGGETKNIYKDSYWFFTKDCQEMLEANHKVVKVEFLDKLEDVYNIEVADNNNFFIGDNDGVLVHNCGLQVEQFRKKYGIIENVSDRLYVSNSFHCHVTEDITPIEKQDLEKRFWDTMNGGKIQYVRYPIDYNTKAVDTLIRRAMDMGFYEGVNLELSYCDDCGHQELDMDVCPVCGSSNLTKISRMNGYLSYSRVKGDSRLNDAKMAEIADRKSM